MREVKIGRDLKYEEGAEKSKNLRVGPSRYIKIPLKRKRYRR